MLSRDLLSRRRITVFTSRMWNKLGHSLPATKQALAGGVVGDAVEHVGASAFRRGRMPGEVD
jgi:hypothetical protein